MPNFCVLSRARREARTVRGFAYSLRAQRANIGEPLGADGRARPTEREREARHGLKPREWDALGVGGVREP